MKIEGRRGFFKFVAVSLGCATLGVNEALAKTTKEAANYIDTPKNGEKCSTCFHFEKKTSTCTIVKGRVAPNGWCKLYHAKGEGHNH